MCSRCKKRVAVVFIASMNGDQTPGEGLCLVCAKELGIKPVDDMMSRMGIAEEDLESLSDQMTDLMSMDSDNIQELTQSLNELDEMSDGENQDGFEPGGAATLSFFQKIFGGPDKAKESAAQENGMAGQKAKNSKQDKADKKKEKKRKYLDTYCDNLTKKAKEGRIDKIIGREREIYRVIQILSRRSKNNPCLVGEPGVGKTAIAEGLALKIANGDVPMKLEKKELFLLDLTALVAGTQFRGQFESRIKGLVDEVKADGNIILFIDEVHNLVGTGDAEGSMNAANILKPALSRGEIQVVGATTFTEYRKYIEKDAALERRFQPVKVEEPSINETIDILQGIKKYYENFHHVTISDGILRKAVILSERYITDRFLPDKAIDLLDEACAHASLSNKELMDLEKKQAELDELSQQEHDISSDVENIDYEKLALIRSDEARIKNELDNMNPDTIDRSVTSEHLAKVIELWTGIPASKIQQEELSRLAKLEDQIKSKIIGQDEAVKAVCNAVRRSRVQISPRRRPASFIFVGPTGVGKTELVKVLARELFDSPETLIRLDMSEFMEKHSVSRIIGSPPGYVGYDEAGQLTEKVRRKPYSVLLFDEIEKAHPDVLNILLQILDEGRITDAQGRAVNFENTVIVMTSNAGSQFKDSSIGFGKTMDDISREKVMKALSEFLRPEFISRVDEIVIFRPLNSADLAKISALMLDELIEPLKEKGINFAYSIEAAELLAKHAGGGKSGARDLRSVIRREVEDKIAMIIVDSSDNPPKGIVVTCDNDKIVVIKGQ